jgi:hypothetical protein
VVSELSFSKYKIKFQIILLHGRCPTINETASSEKCRLNHMALQPHWATSRLLQAASSCGFFSHLSLWVAFPDTVP